MRTDDARADLVARLVGRDGLLDLAASACADAGIAGREQAVAYCVAVLVLKDDPVRAGTQHYRLDVDAEEFPERLAFWAGEVARNLQQWADVHQAVRAEADRYEITTLRTFVRTHRADDHIDEVASRLMPVLAGGPAVDEMALDVLSDRPPAANAYAFQSPLDRWIRTAGRRVLEVRDMDPIDRHAATLMPDDDAGRGAFDEVIEAHEELVEEDLQARLARVARLAETRDLLRRVIDRADDWEAELASKEPQRPEDAGLLVRLRAALLHVGDQLRREQAAVTGMLVYLVLAMRRAAVQQRVAILSLRMRAIDPEVVEDLAHRMRALIGDTRHPTRPLMERTRAAVERQDVPRSRLAALENLPDTPHERASALAPVASTIDRLPGAVEDNAAIADLVTEGNTNLVKSHRSNAAAELSRVDALFGAVFRRYAMGKVA